MLEPERPQMTIWSMYIACWIPKPTNTHSECIILIAFVRQHWFRETALILRPYLHCLSCCKYGISLKKTLNFLTNQRLIFFLRRTLLRKLLTKNHTLEYQNIFLDTLYLKPPPSELVAEELMRADLSPTLALARFKCVRFLYYIHHSFFCHG